MLGRVLNSPSAFFHVCVVTLTWADSLDRENPAGVDSS